MRPIRIRYLTTCLLMVLVYGCDANSGGKALCPKGCDDDNPCTRDDCDPQLGCVHEEIPAPQCDDGDPCTIDRCDPVKTCRYDVAKRLECRPLIRVDYPPRGATIQGDPRDMTIVVKGQLESVASDVSSFLINGVDVPVKPDGSFAQTIETNVGGNAIVLEATNELGASSRRVQSFLWSSEFYDPKQNNTMTLPIDPAGGVWLSQSLIDDNNREPPLDDLASIVYLLLENFDLNSVIDPEQPIAQKGGYDIYLRELTKQNTQVSMQSIQGGIRVQAVLSKVKARIDFDCPCGFPCECFWSGGDSRGGIDIDSFAIAADVVFGVDDDQKLVVGIENTQVSIDGVDVYSDDGWTNFLLSVVEFFTSGSLVSDLENELDNQLTTKLAPMLEEAFGALAVDEEIGIPRLDGSSETIPVRIAAEFDKVNFNAAGGALTVRAGVSGNKAIDYENLGFPTNLYCPGEVHELVLPGTGDFELAVIDQLINAVFYAAWMGGLLEFEVGQEWLKEINLSAYGLTDVHLKVSGLLAPTATDCNRDGSLRIFVGDLKIDAQAQFAGIPIEMVIWAVASLGLELVADQGELGMAITNLDGFGIQVDVTQDELLVVAELLEQQLELQLGELLAQGLEGGSLGSLRLPEIDLHSVLDSLPIGSIIRIVPQSVERQSGSTIFRGEFR